MTDTERAAHDWEPRTRRKTCVVAVLIVALGIVTPAVVTADVSDEDELLAGSGTADDPYVVTSLEELRAIEPAGETHYVLEADIDASEAVVLEGGAGFDPIGDRSAGDPFEGTFDGQNHTISGIHIARPSEDYVGLFGYSEGTVANVSVEDASVVGDSEVGLVVGRNAESGTVRDVSASGTVTATDRRIGGIVGRNHGEITTVGMVGTVESTDREIGGLIGRNAGAIDRSFFVGEVSGERDIGGLIGTSDGSVRSSFANGTVDGERRVGGVVGNNDGAVSAVYAIGDVTGERAAGGIVGDNSGSLSGGLAAASVDGDRSVGALIADNDGIVENAYWDVDATGLDAAFDGDDGQERDVVGLDPWDLTGADATDNTDLEFDGTWKQTDEYPRLAWENDRDVPDEVYEIDVQTEEPEPEPTPTESTDEDDGLLPVSLYWLVAAVPAILGAGGGGYYVYRFQQG
ncbi:GLUG motif-containing protein [Natrialbaceae archaeon A-gly3]